MPLEQDGVEFFNLADWTEEKSIKLRLELEKNWQKHLHETKLADGELTIAIARINWYRFLESLGIRGGRYGLPQARNLMGRTDILEPDPSLTMHQLDVHVLIIPKDTAERILVIGM